MRLRGIRFTLRRPLQSFSYFLVPQLFRCMLLKEEITAACYTKGIDCKQRRSSYFDMLIQRSNWICVLVQILGFLGVMLWQTR